MKKIDLENYSYLLNNPSNKHDLLSIECANKINEIVIWINMQPYEKALDNIDQAIKRLDHGN